MKVTHNGRLMCCVPFCKRTTKRTTGSEWICSKHWRLVDQPHRRVYSRRWRRYRRDGTGVVQVDRLWFWIKRHAIARAMAIE